MKLHGLNTQVRKTRVHVNTVGGDYDGTRRTEHNIAFGIKSAILDRTSRMAIGDVRVNTLLTKG